ncbi:MAG: gamma-glutamyltransferase [Bacteroidetes bacterium]|nr:gamma-glutamyltransferase [Bacteroidota bacterium]MDA1225769.1 gamma-glutamyltransferase [Bacteroidota bacterium]
MRYLLILIIFFSFISCGNEYTPTVVSARKDASDIGIEIMKKGGNAFDAMIGVQLALSVSHPTAGNIAGGGFMVYKLKDGTDGTLDFRETAPNGSFEKMYQDENGNVIGGLSSTGGLAVGVPGTVSAIFEIHKKFGTLPIEELFQPSIDLANNGYLVTKYLEDELNEKRDDFIKLNGSNSIYSKKYKSGDTITNDMYANTLIEIMNKGADGFYKGKVAEDMIKTISESGGIMTMEDLSEYKSVWRDPVRFKYKDYDIISMSFPSSGGVILGQMMKAIENFDLSKIEHNSPEYVQLLTEIERRAFADRSDLMGDPDFMDLPVYEFMDEKYIKDRMSTFSWDKATPSSEIKPGIIFFNESYETTHFSILDKEGNAVSVTTTLNNSFGSKVFVENSGFFLNNEMDDFSSKPGYPNFFGVIGSEANSIQPKKRMLSAMTPTIVLKNNKPHLILGSPGGPSIITSVFQTILNVLEYNMNVNDAVSSPRFHHQWYPDLIVMEDEAYSNDLNSILSQKNYLIVKLPIEGDTLGVYKRSDIGAVDAILIDDNGKVFGGPDLRREHYSSAIE